MISKVGVCGSSFENLHFMFRFVCERSLVQNVHVHVIGGPEKDRARNFSVSRIRCLVPCVCEQVESFSFQVYLEVFFGRPRRFGLDGLINLFR